MMVGVAMIRGLKEELAYMEAAVIHCMDVPSYEEGYCGFMTF
jgi:hypothetical protein